MSIVAYALLLFMLIDTSSMLEIYMTGVAFVMVYILELIMKLSNLSTIQKPYYRQFPELTMASLADALRPDKFIGVHFKRWQIKATLWLTALKIFWVTDGKPQGTISDEDQRKFEEANSALRGCIPSVLADRLCDMYLHITDGKELWDALNTKFSATDAGSELYIMESFHDYKMVNNQSVVDKLMRYSALRESSNSLSVPYPISLWLDALLQSCLLHGGTSPQLSNIRDRRYRLKT